jgi:hypothetical protein
VRDLGRGVVDLDGDEDGAGGRGAQARDRIETAAGVCASDSFGVSVPGGCPAMSAG